MRGRQRWEDPPRRQIFHVANSRRSFSATAGCVSKLEPRPRHRGHHLKRISCQLPHPISNAFPNCLARRPPRRHLTGKSGTHGVGMSKPWAPSSWRRRRRSSRCSSMQQGCTSGSLPSSAHPVTQTTTLFLHAAGNKEAVVTVHLRVRGAAQPLPGSP